MLKKALNLGLVITACSFISACETMNSMQSSVGETFSGIKLASLFSKDAPDGGKKQADVKPLEKVAVAADGTQKDSLGLEHCPQVSIVDELKHLHQFIDINRPTAASAVSSAELKGIKTGCVRGVGTVSLQMVLEFEGALGPRARIRQSDAPSFTYPYLIAIVAPDGTILNKEIFSVPMAYRSNQDRITHFETITQDIPVGPAEDPKSYKVLAGFQLSSDELAYNRAQLQVNAQPPQLGAGLQPQFDYTGSFSKQESIPVPATAQQDHRSEVLPPSQLPPAPRLASTLPERGMPVQRTPRRAMPVMDDKPVAPAAPVAVKRAAIEPSPRSSSLPHISAMDEETPETLGASGNERATYTSASERETSASPDNSQGDVIDITAPM